MIPEWISFRIKYNPFYQSYSPSCHERQWEIITRYFPRYYTGKKKGLLNHNGKNSHWYQHLTNTVAMRSSTESENPNFYLQPQKFAIDSNSFIAGMDSHKSTRIKNSNIHFIWPITTIRGRMVRGLKAWPQWSAREPLNGKIEDDNRKTHKIIIWMSQYVPTAPMYLLDPQQWA